MRMIKEQHYLIPLAYLFMGFMLLLALWNPSIPSGSGPVDLLLLLDESDSIDPAHNNRVWQSFVQQSESLPPGSQISLIRFADRAKVEIPWRSMESLSEEMSLPESGYHESPPRHRFIDTGATDIGSALISAISYTSPDRSTAIIISSDGIDNVSTKQFTSEQTYFTNANNNPDLSLFYLKADNRYQQSNLRIDSVNLPPTSIQQQLLPLSIAIKSDSGAQGTLEVLLNDRIHTKLELRLKADELKVFHLNLNTENREQMIEFIVRDTQGNKLDQRKQIVTRLYDKKLLYIGHNPLHIQTHYLEQDGWEIIQMQPAELPTDEAFFKNMNVILLDNLKADSLNNYMTENLMNAIEQTGTGLMVVGGPDSFGNGNYRFSELEKILPVTAEASRPLPAAAFLFLVDKSGSMEAVNRESSRLADAMRAVNESAKSLRPGDESALLVFDKSVEVLLPLKHRADTVSALNQPWPLNASGGTQLTPALEQSIDILSKSDSEQRFLILVTDGFVDGQNIQPLKTRLLDSGIQLIALAIGNDANIATLQELTSVNKGRILRVNTSAELPHLMRQELETKQKTWNTLSVTPITQHQAPFFNQQKINWSNIQGYQLTRAKSSANVYVTTDKGDPLIAVHNFGAGRVAALPGGILNSKSGENFLTQLMAWLNSHQQSPELHVTHRYLAGKLIINVDAIDADNQWHWSDKAEILLTYPGGMKYAQPLEATAPGHYSDVVNAPVSGVYQARISVDNKHSVYNAYLASNRESQHDKVTPWLQQALNTKTIRLWNESSLIELLHKSSGYVSVRTICLLLALLTFIVLIILERSAGINAYLSKWNILNFKINTQENNS